MAGHTPGPWTVADQGPSDLYILATAPRALIGRVDTDDRADRREAEADARLIAAAPELLALVHQLIEWERETDDPRSDIGGDVEAAARAACAIADNARSVLARCGL